MEQKLTLSELQLLIKNAIFVGVPGFYWVVAEVSEIKVNSYSGHCYLELVEKDMLEVSVKSKIKATIWRNNYSVINRRFEKETGQTIKSGTKILLKCTVEYHELYGISLSVTDINPSFTMGEIEAQRRAIIKRLTDEGVFEMNKGVSFPTLPQRIAIISSENAAGYIDFINHLKNNTEGYKFSTALFETVMQGEATEEAVIASFDRIASCTDDFDVVVMIRGGGSKSDLAWFDNYKIAYYVTQFPLPVLTGIGHDKDNSITDMVAYQSFKTPTATANFLIDSFSVIDGHLQKIGMAIQKIAVSYISKNRSKIESDVARLFSASNQLLKHSDRKLTAIKSDLLNKGKNGISSEKSVIDKLENRLQSNSASYCMRLTDGIKNRHIRLRELASNFILLKNTNIKLLNNGLNNLNPENVLKRGFTLSYKNGVIIKNVSDLECNDVIETRFRDGVAISTVKEVLKEGTKQIKN